MADFYWLPCECGERHRVGSRQAGEQIECACGRSLEVPTLGGLGELEPAEPAAAEADSKRSSGESWNLRQAGMFVGVLMLLGGLAWAVYLEVNKPELIPIEQMKPIQTWALWQELRVGADRFASPPMKRYSLHLKQNRSWLVISLVIAGAGALTIIGTYALVKPSQRG